MAVKQLTPLKTNVPTYEGLYKAGDYLNRFYSTVEGHPEEQGINEFMFRHLHRVFHKHGLRGHRLIDIGTGPVICNVAQACQNFDEVTLSDYAADSRETLRKWVDNKPDSFDWKPFFKYICEIEGHSNVEEWGEKVRNSIKDVIFCDVHQSNPLAPKVTGPFDCVTSAYCLEAASRTKDQYSHALHNIASLLKPGGTFIQLALPLEFYIINGKRYEGFDADKNYFKTALVDAGFTNIELHVLNKTVESGIAISYDYVFFAKATKK